jgi:flagellar biosynthetic protein FliR
MVEILNLLTPANIVVYILVLTRISGLFTSAPFFSTFNLPIQMRVLFACTVAFIMYPVVAKNTTVALPNSMPELVILMFLEFAIGFFIGFLANFVFDAIRIGGGLLSIQMGLSMVNILDPQSGEQSPVMSNVFANIAIMMFFVTGAPALLFETVYYSFYTLPIGLQDVFTGPFLATLLTLSAQMFKIAFALVVPITAILLCLDVLLGFMAKMMPQMNVFMISLPIKIYLSLILLLVFLSSISEFMYVTIGDWFRNVSMLFMGGAP